MITREPRPVYLSWLGYAHNTRTVGVRQSPLSMLGSTVTGANDN